MEETQFNKVEKFLMSSRRKYPGVYFITLVLALDAFAVLLLCGIFELL